MPQLALTLLFIAIGWLLIIRPQQQRMRAQRALVGSLEAGDDVITAGGIHGRLVTVEAETVELRVADGVVLTVARAAIARRRDDGAAGAPEVTEVADGGNDSNDEGEAPSEEDGR